MRAGLLRNGRSLDHPSAVQFFENAYILDEARLNPTGISKKGRGVIVELQRSSASFAVGVQYCIQYILAYDLVGLDEFREQVVDEQTRIQDVFLVVPQD